MDFLSFEELIHLFKSVPPELQEYIPEYIMYRCREALRDKIALSAEEVEEYENLYRLHMIEEDAAAAAKAENGQVAREFCKSIHINIEN
jgi:hypothetical protein